MVNALAEEGYEPDIIVILNPTSPLRWSRDIDQAAHNFLHSQADTLLSVFSRRICLWERQEGGIYRANYDFEHKGRTQDLPEKFEENGAIYMVSRKFLLDKKEFLGGRVVFCKMPEERSIDIDTPLDFVCAEAILNASVIVKS